jgi:hypothetical protein
MDAKRLTNAMQAIVIKIMSPVTTSVRGFVPRSGCKKGPVSNVDLAIVLLRGRANRRVANATIGGKEAA